MAILIVASLGDLGGRMMRLVVPGQAEFRLNEAGTYTIFHEYHSVVDGRAYALDALSGLQIIVRHRGSAIELARPTVSSRYSVGSFAGRSLFQFEVNEPGVYLVRAVYGDGRKEPQTVLAIDRNFVGSLVRTILQAFGIGLGSTALAIAIFGVVLVKRRRALRALTAPPR